MHGNAQANLNNTLEYGTRQSKINKKDTYCLFTPPPPIINHCLSLALGVASTREICDGGGAELIEGDLRPGEGEANTIVREKSSGCMIQGMESHSR